MLKSLKIEWEKTNLNGLNNHEDTWFYAFSRGNGLIYVGIAYHQDVVKEIKQSLRAFDINTAGLSIYLGYIAESDYGRITEQIVRDTECLLIYVHQPSYNVQCTANYTGRDNLKIKNRGCNTLRPCIKIESMKIYHTCR